MTRRGDGFSREGFAVISRATALRVHEIWNCEGSFLVQKPPTAQNFSFGHIGVDAVVFNIPLQDPTKEGGYIESLDRHVMPRSLYLTQLRERLGDAAVRNVAVPSQVL